MRSPKYSSNASEGAMPSGDQETVAPMHIRKNTSPASTSGKPAESPPGGFSAPPTTADSGKVRLCGLAPTLMVERPLSKAFIDDAMRAGLILSGAGIDHVAEVVAAAMIAELQASRQFVLPGVGTFTLHEMEAAAPAGTKARKTVQFEACPSVLCQV